jgi:hypothetical protein
MRQIRFICRSNDKQKIDDIRNLFQVNKITDDINKYQDNNSGVTDGITRIFQSFKNNQNPGHDDMYVE